jgi:hypothetical protein
MRIDKHTEAFDAQRFFFFFFLLLPFLSVLLEIHFLSLIIFPCIHLDIITSYEVIYHHPSLGGLEMFIWPDKRPSTVITNLFFFHFKLYHYDEGIKGRFGCHARLRGVNWCTRLPRQLNNLKKEEDPWQTTYFLDGTQGLLVWADATFLFLLGRI